MSELPNERRIYHSGTPDERMLSSYLLKTATPQETFDRETPPLAEFKPKAIESPS